MCRVLRGLLGSAAAGHPGEPLPRKPMCIEYGTRWLQRTAAGRCMVHADEEGASSAVSCVPVISRK